MKSRTKDSRRTPVGETRTNLIPHVRLFPEGFLSEEEAAEYLNCSRSSLRMYRVKWNQTGHGTGTGADGCGPLFFQGPSGRIAYRREDLDLFKNRTADPTLWKPARATANRGKK